MAWCACGPTVAGKFQSHEAWHLWLSSVLGNVSLTHEGDACPLASSAKSMIAATRDLFISPGPAAFRDCLRLSSALAGSREHSWDLPSAPMWPQLKPSSLQQTMQNSLLWHLDLPLSLSRLLVLSVRGGRLLTGHKQKENGVFSSSSFSQTP